MADIEEDIKEVVKEAVKEAEDDKPEDKPDDFLVPEHNHPRYDEEISGITGRLDVLTEMVSTLSTPPVEIVEIPVEPEPLEEELEDVTPDELKEEEGKEPPKEEDTKPKEEEKEEETPAPKTDTKPKTFWERFWG